MNSGAIFQCSAQRILVSACVLRALASNATVVNWQIGAF